LRGYEDYRCDESKHPFGMGVVERKWAVLISILEAIVAGVLVLTGILVAGDWMYRFLVIRRHRLPPMLILLTILVNRCHGFQ
jgi:hypothetical protein